MKAIILTREDPAGLTILLYDGTKIESRPGQTNDAFIQEAKTYVRVNHFENLELIPGYYEAKPKPKKIRKPPDKLKAPDVASVAARVRLNLRSAVRFSHGDGGTPRIGIITAIVTKFEAGRMYYRTTDPITDERILVSVYRDDLEFYPEIGTAYFEAKEEEKKKHREELKAAADQVKQAVKEQSDMKRAELREARRKAATAREIVEKQHRAKEAERAKKEKKLTKASARIRAINAELKDLATKVDKLNREKDGLMDILMDF